MNERYLKKKIIIIGIMNGNPHIVQDDHTQYHQKVHSEILGNEIFGPVSSLKPYGWYF